MEEVGKVEVKRQPVKWWIRRHRVLALLAPFLGMAALLFLWGGVEMFFIDRIPSEKPFQELCECVWFALVLASIGMTRVFDMGPAKLVVYRWLSWPFFLFPAMVFVLSRKTPGLISAYVLYFILVCVGIAMGYMWAASQMV